MWTDSIRVMFTKVMIPIDREPWNLAQEDPKSHGAGYESLVPKDHIGTTWNNIYQLSLPLDVIDVQNDIQYIFYIYI